MGLFSKKEDRIYSLEEALKLLKMPKYANYTTVPVGNGFKIVPEKEVPIQPEYYIETTHGYEKKRENFVSEVSGQGYYRNLNTVPNYNNYQSAKGYQKSNCRNLGR